MNKNLDLLNIEVGTFERVKHVLTLKISKSQFRYDSINELNELKLPNENFLPVKSIQEKDNNVIIEYLLSNDAMSLKEIPKQRKAIKTAIAKRIMEQDVLSDNTYNISMNPANIWYYPMNKVWYAYRANESMPYDDRFNALTRYKAVVLYIMTGAPYERLLTNPQEAMPKSKDELINQIINAVNVEDLKSIVRSIDEYVAYREWQDVDRQIQKSKKRTAIIAGVIGISAILLVAGVHHADNAKYAQLEQANKNKVIQVEAKSKLQSAIANKDWKSANGAMERAGYSRKQKVATYLDNKQYQQALNTDSTKVLEIVKRAYENNDEKAVLTLKTPSGTLDKNKDQLALEKHIINYDEQDLTEQVSFATNPDVLLRLGRAFVEHDNEQYANMAQKKLAGIDTNKAKYLQAIMDLKSVTKRRDDAQKKLDDANHIDDKDDSKKDKVKSAQSDVDNANKDIKTAQKKVDDLKKKVGY